MSAAPASPAQSREDTGRLSSWRRQAANIRYGAIPAVAGFIAVLVAYTVTPWINKGTSTFGTVAARLTQRGQNFNGWAQNYFVWLGWVLLGVVFVLAIAANLPLPVYRWCAGAGALLAAVAVALTFYAIRLTLDPIVSYGQYLGLARSGFYTTLAGFLAMGLGAALGLRRTSDASAETAT